MRFADGSERSNYKRQPNHAIDPTTNSHAAIGGNDGSKTLIGA
jgi:hypothetical protein